LDLKHNHQIIKPQFANIKNIIIAPFSTDIKKNLTINATNELTLKLTSLFPHAKIRVALTGDFLLKKFVAKKFTWTKSTKNSQKYLKLLKQTDLFVGVDSGPLHLSLALNIPTIAIFGATAPATILDYKTEVLIWRDIKLTKYFCQVGKCKKAICISNVIKQENLLNYNYQVIENLKYERKNCPLELS
jgi:ADP-heptose:LPS heptosyltransferase